MNAIRPFLAIAAAIALATACNSIDNERFNEQKESYIFESTTSRLVAFGAGKIESESDNAMFRCPTVSGMSNESSLTVFQARANAPLPHFTVHTVASVTSAMQGGFGFSLADFPIETLDVYERCNASSFEKLVTACPDGYEVVDACSSNTAKECVLRHEGTHRLVISAHIDDDRACFMGETSADGGSVTEAEKICNAYSAIPIVAAYRGNQPSNNCCNADDESTLDFCIKPCGCRTLTVEFAPKDESGDATVTDVAATPYAKDLRIAVFSNVEGKLDHFRALLESIRGRDVDLAVSLGNLTASGRESQFRAVHDLVDEAFLQSGEAGCTRSDSQICCSDTVQRTFANRCNAVLRKTAFLAGLGENESGSSSLAVFRNLFGPSNSSSTFGKVQVILLDTADSTLVSAQREWLESVLVTPSGGKCQIRSPKDLSLDGWPLLRECRAEKGVPDAQAFLCRDCLGVDAWCVPPDADHSRPEYGRENCVCIPMDSTYCRSNFHCPETDGLPRDCVCTRDEDCGKGGTCADGVCRPPVRLVFSYTPIFDESGSRNGAFTSKNEAASLLSLLIRSGVSHIFAGRVLDYSHYVKGGIDMYITGGGGAKMSSFSDVGHHWLLVTVPNAYANPNPKDISVEVVEF